MNSKTLFLSLFFTAILLNTAPAVAGDEQSAHSKLSRIVDQTHEKSVYAEIKMSTGMVYINKAPESKIFAGDFFFTERPPLVNYEIIGDEGRLAIRFTEKHSKKRKEYNHTNYDDDCNIGIDELYDNECYLNFSDQVPLSLKMDFGVIKGNLDLGGLQLNDCEITTAVSQATIDFNIPNQLELKRLGVENGVGKLRMINIGNAKFSEFKFDAGVGSYELDFGKEIFRHAVVDIEIGMGKLDIYLPRSAGVRIRVDKSFLSSFNIDDIYKKDNYYYNDKWGTSTPSLDIDIETGVAKVNVEWID